MNVFSIIFPVIFVTCVGYLCARQNFISREQINGLSKLTFNIILPSFLFVTMATNPMAEVFNPNVIGAFYLPVIGIYSLALLYHYCFAEQSKQIGPAAVFAMGNTYSNVVLLGLPVTLAALGEALVPHVFMILSFHGLIMIGFTSFCGTFHQSGDEQQAGNQQPFAVKLLQMVKNPILASIFGGMLYNVAGFTIAADIASALKMLGKPGITCALIVLGSSLHFYSVKGKLGQIGSLTLVKLVMLPLAVWLSATYLFELEQQLIALVVILSASPTGVNAYLVACTVKSHEALVASTVVVTTVLCMFTMAGWLLFLL